jgi:mono/diheme cytochrome c family protein
MKNRLLLMCGGLFVMSAFCVSLGAQVAATRSVNDGVFTAEQAKRGEVVYKEQCSTCHGDNLEGSGPMPPLAGKDFLASWTGKTVGDLFEKVTTTMPATAPGTLTPAQGADTVAYMLSAGKYPAGTMELDSKLEALAQIKVDPPKDAAGQ